MGPQAFASRGNDEYKGTQVKHGLGNLRAEEELPELRPEVGTVLGGAVEWLAQRQR